MPRCDDGKLTTPDRARRCPADSAVESGSADGKADAGIGKVIIE
jgi:hypothetical protein